MLVNLLQKLKMLYLVTSFLSALVKELQAADIKLRQNATGTQRGKTPRQVAIGSNTKPVWVDWLDQF